MKKSVEYSVPLDNLSSLRLQFFLSTALFKLDPIDTLLFTIQYLKFTLEVLLPGQVIDIVIVGTASRGKSVHSLLASHILTMAVFFGGHLSRAHPVKYPVKRSLVIIQRNSRLFLPLMVDVECRCRINLNQIRRGGRGIGA
jgi:hypothetical protein